MIRPASMSVNRSPSPSHAGPPVNVKGPAIFSNSQLMDVPFGMLWSDRAVTLCHQADGTVATERIVAADAEIMTDRARVDVPNQQ